MPSNIQRKTSDLANIVVADTSDNVTLPSNLTVNSIQALSTASNAFLVSDGGMLKFRTGAQVLSDIGAINTNIYTADGTLTGNRTVTMGSNTLSFSGDIKVNGLTIGKGGGNANNTAVGFDALAVNTTGFGNSAFGIQSGRFLSTGLFNSAFGLESLRSSTAGVANSAFGYYSLYNSQGSRNTSIGSGSFSTLSSGNDNTSLGTNSGSYLSNGVTGNTICNTSIFIGAETKALDNNQTNQIVIGYSSTGLGSNTTVIGNSSTTDTAIYGRMLVNYTAPVLGTYALDVNGTFKAATAATNNIAVFSGVEPNINISATGGTNSAAVFLSPSAGYNGAVHNRTGGGLEFYTGATPSVAMTIGSNLNVGIGSAPNNINALQVGIANKFSGAFIGNLGGARTPSVNYGLHLGWNYSTSGESNIIWGTGTGANPYLTFSSFDGTTKTDRLEIQNNGNIVFKNYTSATSFTGTPVGYLGFDANGNILTTTGGGISGSGTTNYIPKFTGVSALGDSALQTDASGNLGLGVTPSAWGSNWKALELSNGVYLTAISASTVPIMILGANAYFDNTNFIYKTTTAATRYQQDSGVHYWYNAPSGTAGAAITFTQAMTLTANGRLLINQTSDSGEQLQVNGSGKFSGNLILSTNDARIRNDDATGRIVIGNSVTSTYGIFYGSTHSTSPNTIALVANSILSLTIASTGAATFSGSVGVGGASATYSLTAYNSANGTTAAFGGTARGIRIDNDGAFSSGRSTIYGVDNTFYNSYQPLAIGGSELYFSISGVDKLSIASTGAATFSSTVSASSYYSSGVELITSDGSANYLKTGTNLYIQNGSTTVASISNVGAASFSSSVLSTDFRTNGAGFITFDANNAGSGTLVIRGGTTGAALSFAANNAATFSNTVDVVSNLSTTGRLTADLTSTGLTGGANFYVTTSVAKPTINSGITWGGGNVFINQQGILQPTFSGSATFNSSNYVSQELKINRITFASAASTITMSQASGGIRAYSNAVTHNYIDGTNNGTISHFANIAMYGDYAASTAKFTFDNRYGLLINDFQEFAQGHTYTNRWAIYQDGASDNNYFKGKVIIGSTNTVGASPLNVKNLPTSAAGLATGDVWNNGGVLNIV